MRRLCGILAAMLMLAAADYAVPAAAQDSAKQQAKAPLVEMAFNPPLDRVLRFRVTKTKFKDGKPSWPSPVAMVEEARFVRSGDGYILYWRIDPASLPAVFNDPKLKPFIAPMIAPFTGESIAFDLDASGELVRVRDWPATRARVLQSVDAFMTASRMAKPTDGDTLAKVEVAIRGLFDRLDEKDAATTLLDDLSPALGWGGLSMALGSSRTAETEIPIALFHTAVKADVVLTLVSVDPGRITLTNETRINRDALLALVDTMIKQFGATRTAAQDKELAELKNFSVATNVRFVFDSATGLPLSVSVTRQASNQPGPLETRQIEWLR